MAVMNVFVFLAGMPSEELAAFKPPSFKGDFAIFVPQNDAWQVCIESVYGDKCDKFSRYAIRKDPVFDSQKLNGYINAVDKTVALRLIDESLYCQSLQNEWSKDFVCNYPDCEAFLRLGLGVVAVENGEIIAGASSFSSYNGGIEIEIVTREDHRRRGLAAACGAKLILESLQRKLYPNWDAATRISVALAEKLGYRFSHEYAAYRIKGYV
jgi:GNAT superfamily N-acetyltransferase